MSIFTVLNEQQIKNILIDYELGTLTHYSAIAGGTQNTNYLLSFDQAALVLTVYERDDVASMDAVLHLIDFLAKNQYPCSAILANKSQQLYQMVAGKPVFISQFIQGQHYAELNTQQCQILGHNLAKLHCLTMDYPLQRANVRNLAWIQQISQQVMPKLKPAEQTLLASECAYQSSLDYGTLPRGIIHADLFLDNVLFKSNELTGIVDFYDACHDYYLLDIVIAINDSCRQGVSELDPLRIQAFLQGYETARMLLPTEKAAFKNMQRLAALSFWLLRLQRLHFQRASAAETLKDPKQYENLLKAIMSEGS